MSGPLLAVTDDRGNRLYHWQGRTFVSGGEASGSVERPESYLLPATLS